MSGWKGFCLRPHDVLFFRDGKPSNIGADHYLRSLFPPYPSTLYGAVRTRRLLDAGVDLKDLKESNWRQRLGPLAEELGGWGGFGSLKLRGPWLLQCNRPLTPAPADLGLTFKSALQRKDDRPVIQEVVRFRIDEEAASVRRWSHPLQPLFPFDRNGERWGGGEPRSAAGDWFLKPEGLAEWRRGGVPEPEQLVHRTKLWLDEPRTGVGLEAGQRTSQEGRLYTFGFIRLHADVALGFEVSGDNLHPGGLVRLGGEGRTAALEPGPAFPAMTAIPEAGNRFAVSFVTPALSATGGYPPGFGKESLEGELGGRRCRLVAAAVPRFLHVGGYDLARDFPKPLRRALPPGSVFVFEALDGGPPPLSEVDGHCYSDFVGEELARRGFGLAVAGLA